MDQILTEAQIVVLELAAASLFNKTVSIPASQDWSAVFREAAAQAVLPTISAKACSFMPEAEQAVWRKYTFRHIAKNLFLNHEQMQLHQLMVSNQIGYVVLKGHASAAYYPDPALRAVGDVDFFVERGDLDRAGEVLIRAGFTPVENNESQAHIAYYRQDSKWEMHWSLAGLPDGAAGSLIRGYISDMIETAGEAKILDGAYRVPDQFHHGLVLLVHTALHLINTGVGLRHLCDWAVFSNALSNEAFCEVFEERLKTCGLWRFAQLLTQLSVKYLDCPEKAWAMEAVDDDLLEAMIADIFAGGNFGLKDSQRINQAKLMTDRAKGTVDGGSMAKQFVATMNEKAKIGMPACRKIPVLLPVGWVYVGTRHLLRIKAGKRPEIRLGKMIQGAASRKEIYKQFRLFETNR